METQGREYKYQKSWNIGNEMIVVRSDDFQDFMDAIGNIGQLIPKTKAFPEDSGPQATPQSQVTSAPTCGIHNIPMVWKAPGVSKTSGKPYPGFWSCKERNQDGSYCKFRPEK